MKISAIEKNKTSNSLSKKVKQKKDLTSFGLKQNQTSPAPDTDSKKADEAIKTTFLSNVSFAGHTVQITSRRIPYSTSGALEYKVDDGAGRDFYYTPQQAVEKSKYSYINSTIEKINNAKSDNVYFADPLEVVPDNIKSNYSFVVYDNEPKFPSFDMIKRKYMSADTYYEDLNQYCKTIYDYHERLKNADIKERLNLKGIKEQQEKELAYAEEYKRNLEQNSVNPVWGETNKEILDTAEYFCRINRSRLYFTNEKIDYYKNRLENSKEQQILASTLYSILDEAGSLFMERDRLCNKKHGLRCTDLGYIKTKEELLQAINDSKFKLSSLESKYATTEAWRDLKVAEYEEENKKNSDNYWWNKDYKPKALNEIEKLNKKLKNILAEINDLKPRIQNAQEISPRYDKINNEIKVVLDKLAKLYPKAENFYKVNAQRLRCV